MTAGAGGESARPGADSAGVGGAEQIQVGRGEGPRRGPLATGDPWAHRRGEPRLFAFAWTLYLLGSTAITVLATMARSSGAGAGPEAMRPAVRLLMVLVVLGVVLVWPMIRLSQGRERRPLAATAQDLVVVLVPIQAVVWPQGLWWLARWPLSVVAGQAAVIAAWGLVVGGMVALGQSGGGSRPSGGRRIGGLAGMAWMGGIAAGLVLSLLPALFAGSRDRALAADVTVREFRGEWMASPVAAVLEVGRERSWSGLPGDLRPGHWWSILATAGASVPIWGAAWVRARGPEGRRKGVPRPPAGREDGQEGGMAGGGWPGAGAGLH
jgi:hypothetical protein